MKSRLVLALFVAPVVPACIISGVSAISAAYHNLVDSLIGFLFIYQFAAIVTIVVGLPTFLALKHFSLVNWWSSIGAGALAGYIAALVFGPESFSARLLHGYVPFMVIGGAAGLVFFAVYRSGLPSRLTFVRADAP